MSHVVRLLVTHQEIDTLAVALARSIDPESEADNAQTAATDIWRVIREGGDVPLHAGSLATMLAEAQY